MKNIMKWLAICLILSFLPNFCSLCISAQPVIQNFSPRKSQTTKEQFVTEIPALREQTVKHFDVGNGMYEAISYGHAIHRKDSDGNWQDIDNRLFSIKANDHIFYAKR